MTVRFYLLTVDATDLRPGDRFVQRYGGTDLHVGPPISSVGPTPFSAVLTTTWTVNGGAANHSGPQLIARPDEYDLSEPDVWAPVFTGELVED